MINESSAPPCSNSRRAFPVRTIVLLCRAAIAVVFVYAGVLKAIHPAQLMIDIQRYQLVSDRLAWLAASHLPYLEIFGSIALIIPKTEEAGRLILGGLLLVFIGALISAWIRGLDITCGCFGHSTADIPNYLWWLTRDLILLATLAATMVGRRRKFISARQDPAATTEVCLEN